MAPQILADQLTPSRGADYAHHIDTYLSNLPTALYKISQSVSHTNELFTTEVQEIHNESEFSVFRGLA